MFSSCTVIGSVFCHYVTATSMGKLENSSPFGAAMVTLEVPIQEGSSSLATYRITSNHVISTEALIGLIMST